MVEQYPSDAELNALSGTADAEQEVLFVATGESPYYTSFYKMLHRLLNVARRAGDLRVYKDGDLTFGVRAGRLLNGDDAVDFAGAAEQGLTDNATNYIYLTGDGTLAVNTTGFPTPSETPHIPLATIETAGGAYTHNDMTDYRGRALLSVAAGLSGVASADAAAFFQATDLSGTEAETLSDGSNADALHVHGTAGLEDASATAAKLTAPIQDLLASLSITAGDESGDKRTITVQAKDAGGADLAERLLVRVWVATSDYGAPDATDNSVAVETGTTYETEIANAAYSIISDAAGKVEVGVTISGAASRYICAEIDGRAYSSGEVTWAA